MQILLHESGRESIPARIASVGDGDATVHDIIGACLVDSDSGLVLTAEGGGGVVDPETMGAANMEVVCAKNTAPKALALKGYTRTI
ncbi:hypothetical protein J3R80_17175 [Aliiroseovarius sp. Z3]|uniref:hypothetical protein n=1 Tax=Aliiroseovarius sp. Z3 TaxID=2811402 RepID=UPI0023B33E7A|nr:hypothetical protein [Aliiroseovarius sp. Z3]MDE9452207.1 hypothetical protein [Aliiroseovarius sp. Z3]